MKKSVKISLTLTLALTLGIGFATVGFAAANKQVSVLAQLNDRQKMLLNELADQYIWPDQKGKPLNKVVRREFAKELTAYGLGQLELVNLIDKSVGNGLTSVIFQDPNTKTIGMTFRGIDGGAHPLAAAQDFGDCLLASGFGSSLQITDALALFDTYHNPNGDNYLFGHSKGGELASEIYVRNDSLVKRLFMSNPQPINSHVLTAEQKAALQSSKVEVVVIDGDFVWQLGKAPYAVRFIKNNHRRDGEFVGPHMIDTAYFDDDGKGVNLVTEPNPYAAYQGQKLAGKYLNVFIDNIQVIVKRDTDRFKAILPW